MLYFIFIAIALSKNAKMDINLTIGLDFSDNSYMEFFGNFQNTMMNCNRMDVYSLFIVIIVKLNIAQHLLPCYSCYTRHQFKEQEKHCLGGGRYCQYSDYVSGQTILKEFYFNSVCWKYYHNIILIIQSTLDNNVRNHQWLPVLRIILLIITYQLKQQINVLRIVLIKVKQQIKKLRQIAYQNSTKMEYNQTSFSLYLDSSDQTDLTYNEFLQKLCQKYTNVSISFCDHAETPVKQVENANANANTSTNANPLEQVFLFIFALIILIIAGSGGWTLLNKIQFGSSLVPKSRIAIPKLEGDHIIQEDDI